MMITMEGKYQTRDGRAVRILCVDAPMGKPPVVGFIVGNYSVDGDSQIVRWGPDGRIRGDRQEDRADLIPVPTKHEGWVIISRTTGLPLADNCRGIWMDRSDAVAFCNEAYNFVAHVTWED